MSSSRIQKELVDTLANAKRKSEKKEHTIVHEEPGPGAETLHKRALFEVQRPRGQNGTIAESTKSRHRVFFAKRGGKNAKRNLYQKKESVSAHSKEGGPQYAFSSEGGRGTGRRLRGKKNS